MCPPPICRPQNCDYFRRTNERTKDGRRTRFDLRHSNNMGASRNNLHEGNHHFRSLILQIFRPAAGKKIHLDFGYPETGYPRIFRIQDVRSSVQWITYFSVPALILFGRLGHFVAWIISFCGRKI